MDDARTSHLTAGDRVPHVAIATLDGGRVDYAADVWQRKQLLLVSLASPGAPAAAAFVRALAARADDCAALDTACLVTGDEVPGVPRPGVLIADRWGEVQHVAGGTVEELPQPDALVAWLQFLAQQCPECEGESR